MVATHSRIDVVRREADIHAGMGDVQGDTGLCKSMWNGTDVLGKDGDNNCMVVPGKKDHWTWGGGSAPNMCLRQHGDDLVKKQKLLPDCAELAFLWKNLQDGANAKHATAFSPCGQEGQSKLFVDIGANIGTCSMQMLSRPDVPQVVAFEPSPKNLFYLTGSVFQNVHFSQKLTLFPEVIGEKVSNTSKTLTLDEMFMSTGTPPYIHLMKIGAQGFEMPILRGGRQLFKSGAVNALQFRLAKDWLKSGAMPPLDFINLLLKSGFELHQHVDVVEETTKLPRALTKKQLKHMACIDKEKSPTNLFAVFDYESKGVPEPIEC